LPATLDTIAKEAAVSKATVSLALNGRGSLSAGTRKRIQTIAKRMNYRPRSVGRPAVRSQRIAIVCARDVESKSRLTLFSQIIESARQAVEAGGDLAHLMVGDGMLASNLLKGQIRDEHIDGLILLAVREGSGQLELINDLEIPAVVVNVYQRPQRFSFVSVDNYGGMRQAAERLIEMGHTHLAMIHNAHRLSYNLDRQAGFADAVRAAGLNVVAMHAIDPMADDAEDHYRRLAGECAETATAVCLTNDRMAVQFIDAAEQVGVAVPRDLSVVGFDDQQLTSGDGLRPSSVATDFKAIGREAAVMLQRLLAEPEIRHLSTVLPAMFVEHDTTLSRRVSQQHADTHSSESTP